jgi:hypothetical protein
MAEGRYHDDGREGKPRNMVTVEEKKGMWWEETWAEGKGRERHDKGRECHSVTAEQNVTAIAEGNVVEGNIMAEGRKGREQESIMTERRGTAERQRERILMTEGRGTSWWKGTWSGGRRIRGMECGGGECHECHGRREEAGTEGL